MSKIRLTRTIHKNTIKTADGKKPDSFNCVVSFLLLTSLFPVFHHSLKGSLEGFGGASGIYKISFSFFLIHKSTTIKLVYFVCAPTKRHKSRATVLFGHCSSPVQKRMFRYYCCRKCEEALNRPPFRCSCVVIVIMPWFRILIDVPPHFPGRATEEEVDHQNNYYPGYCFHSFLGS